MGLVADFFVQIFNAFVGGAWQFLVLFQVYCISALSFFLTTLITTVMPSPLAANVLPYVAWIEAINQWVPLSEAIAFLVGGVVFKVSWLAVKLLLRFFTLGLLGKG